MKNISWCYPKIINKISEGSNDMSGGEIAALIAAVAFVVLVIFLVLVLYKVSQVVSKIEDTIDETNTTIKRCECIESPSGRLAC